MGKTQTVLYDPVKYLDTAEDIVTYIDVLLEDGDVRLFEAALMKEIVPAIKRYGVSVDDIERLLDRVARQNGYVRERVGHILASCWRAAHDRRQERDQSVSQSPKDVSRQSVFSGVGV